jgi:Outer membrane receptor proteins, mostly Fe transport
VHLHSDGSYNFKTLPFGSYRLTVSLPGFQPSSELLDLRSEVPVNKLVTLGVAPVEMTFRWVSRRLFSTRSRPEPTTTLERSRFRIGRQVRPGRGLLDVISSQPGWLLEANGVLHPRGSEYATQYIVDGFPIQDNRSPAFAPSFEADDVQELQILTGAYPAEYGKKLGGVIAVTTQRNTTPGLHNSAVLQGGSFSTLSGFFASQYSARKSTASLSAEGFLTDRYLDPPVQANFSNHASNTAFTGSWERDLSAADRLRTSISRRATRFLVPDELLQQNAGQRQDRTSLETAGQISYQHVFSADIAGSVRGMVRDISAQLWSNPLSTPIYAAQDRGFREAYVNADVTGHHGRHIWKAGTEESFADLHEAFSYRISAYKIAGTRIFDRDTPAQLAIADRRQDREQSAFVQDQVRLGNLTLNLGLRYDHYSLLVKDQAWSPRLAAAWFVPGAKLVLHASYDRIFGTPATENLLVSASPLTASVNNAGFYLPLRPSHANFVEAGFSKSISDKIRFDANWFRRAIRNFGDDDVLLNTGVSFPIAFDRAAIHGIEAKVEVPQWRRFSGFAGYSWMVGLGQLPIAGGLFLEDSAAELLHGQDKFPITQDQRHTAHARVRYNVSSRVSAALGAHYASGLPIQRSEGQSEAFLVSQYGQPLSTGSILMPEGCGLPSPWMPRLARSSGEKSPHPCAFRPTRSTLRTG